MDEGMPSKAKIPPGRTKYCAGCGKVLHVSAETCPNCGYKTESQKTKAIVGLVLNLLVWPGVGTIVGGETRKGVWQIVLFLISIPLILVIIGIPLLIGIWIWALVTSINQITKSE
jgi:TM2 domain-containing membrane protein YozV